MRSVSYWYPLILLCTLSLGGCFTIVHYPERPRLECADPVPPPCRPDSFSQTTIDTSSTAGRSPYHLSITRVSGLDGADDEFSVGFIRPEGSMGLATIRERSERPIPEELIAVRFPSLTRAVAERTMNFTGIEGAVGGASTIILTRTIRGEGREPGSITAGQRIFFAARPWGTVAGDYDLFSADEYGSGITDIAPLREISSVVYWDAQPAVSSDGMAIYFSSDRPGGFGGTDIYISRRRPDSTWGTPENAGPGVNTSCDELSPSVSGNGRWLYFSSAGHATVGGYDLFRSRILGDQFGAAENLGRPINTDADELFPSTPSGADPDTLLYYSSNQPGSQGFDIYVLHRLRKSGRTITPVAPRQILLSGVVVDADGRPVPRAQVTIEQRDPPGPAITVEANPEGKFQTEVQEGSKYSITAGSATGLFKGEEIRIPILDGRTTFPYDITIPDTVTFRVNFPFNDASNPYPFTLDENGVTTDLRWTDMIDRAATFLQQFNNRQEYRFQIAGHTDPVGSDPFNLDLGRRRAEFIRNELVKRGVSSSLVSVSSEGESRPLRQREGENEDLYHARLRRVELVRK